MAIDAAADRNGGGGSGLEDGDNPDTVDVHAPTLETRPQGARFRTPSVSLGEDRKLPGPLDGCGVALGDSHLAAPDSHQVSRRAGEHSHLDGDDLASGSSSRMRAFDQ